MSEANFTS